MKRTFLIVSIFLSIIMNMAAQNKANSFENDWNKVAQFDKDDLPKSASEEVEKILKKAISEKNNQQVIKALLMKNKYKIVINNKDNLGIFTDLQNLIVQTNDESEKALLHSLLAELYIEYYNSNRWNISERTDLFGVVPDDMQEWSANIFADKTIENLKLSIEKADLLKRKTTKEYSHIIVLGKDSEKYYPTLFDFLMKRVIKLSSNIPENPRVISNKHDTGYPIEKLAVPANEFVKLNIKNNWTLQYYQQYFKDLINRNMTPTIILTEVDKVKYIGSFSYSFESLGFLKQLAERYQSDETVVAIIEEIVKKLLSQNEMKESRVEAYNWCTDAIKKYPNYPLIDNIKNIQKLMEQPLLDLNSKITWYPENNVEINIAYKNLQSLKEYPLLKLYKINGTDSLLIKEYPINYVSATTYQPENKDLDLGKLVPGSYVLKTKDFTESRNDITLNFTVSRFASFSRNSAKGVYDIYVVDRVTGKPIKDAIVSIYNGTKRGTSSSRPIATTKTDELGLASMKNVTGLNSKNYFSAYYTIKYGEDISPQKSIYEDYSFSYDDGNRSVRDDDYTSLSIFTDRSIYRPGQTVYFKVVATDKDRKPLVNNSLTIELQNTSGETVSKKELKTNEFASVAGEFILPQTGLLGGYSITVTSKKGQNSTYINVEEYKRPTFEITFDKVEKTYSFGEEVTIKGFAKNYSGVSLQDATVKYTVKGNRFSFWRYMGQETFSEVGEVSTKEDGSFEILFTPQAGDLRPSYPFFDRNNIQQFTITAKVTDLNNETQSGNFSMLVGDVSMVINMNNPSKVEKSDKLNIKIEALNLNGTNIETNGEYTIYTVNENDSIANKVSSGVFRTGEQPEMSEALKRLASGKYRIKLTAKDSNRKDVESESDILIYSYSDKKPPIKTNEWLVEKNTTFASNKKAEILFGVSDKDVNVLYQLYNNKNIFENKRIVLSDENKLFTIPYKAEYGDEVYLSLTYIKDEKYYNQNILLKKEKVNIDTDLKVKLEVFRDKLRPGQEEIWTLSVKDTKENPVLAEVLASMYDTSLDQLTSSNSKWHLELPYQGIRGINPYNYNLALDNYITRNSLQTSWWFTRNMKGEYFIFDTLDKFGFSFYGNRIMIRGKSHLSKVDPNAEMLMSQASGVNMAELQEHAVIVGEDAKTDGVLHLTEAKAKPPVPSDAGDNGMQTPQIRQNFNETAFFYPQLRTNDKGETLISFTVPESNTQWRFRVLAHDKDMKIGQMEQLVVTRKELMVTPNMPRFVRQGDKTSISTKISNLSDDLISGKVYIEFFDPITDKTVDLNLADKEQSFNIEKDASTSVNWTFDIPADIDLLGCRIVAANEVFSDGEQHVLSVLPNRMLVTESMPFDVTEQGENIFVYDKLKNNNSKSLQNYKLTFEYTSNPAWYAVQALPTLSNPTNNDVVSWFASYYVNTLGASIVRQYPQVTNMIKAWQKQGGDQQTLMSKLQKDEELKNILLTETPWVLEAKDETEQMRRLSLLFDLNNTKQQTEQATQKIADLQDAIGGWSWYKGMYPSRSITQYLLYGYAKLQRVGQVEYNEQIKMMQIQALSFIDKEIISDYQRLKNNNKDWQKIETISTNQLEYLYVRTFYRDIPITQEAREAERFYTSVVSKNWQKLDLYERSLFVIVLIKNGEKELANKISKSIEERAIVDKKQGMYWANNSTNSRMPKIDIAKHTFLMDALNEMGATTQELDMMKQWLVKQKQTQVWESTPATINAIAALLGTGSDWFATEKTTSTIKVGNENISDKNAELGTGYIKQTWGQEEIKSNLAEVRIEKKDSQPSYGALYWQYYENLDKISQNKTGLNIDKQMFKETKSNTGQIRLVPITVESPLQVGDKVTMRLTVRVDSDMDFVQVKDMRAPCFEPVETLSKVKWMNNTIYYQETRDASTNLYLDHIAKGTYVFEYQVYVNRTGTYSNGITTIQSLYAPEFVSHTDGEIVIVK